MKTIQTFTAIFFIAILSSCTGILVEEVRGGHSPMQQLNGTWDVTKSLQTENGVITGLNTADGVWFNATLDQGGYCDGQWLQPGQTVDPDFQWSFSANGDIFYLKDPATGDYIEWNVAGQDKNYFHITREENGIAYELEMQK